MGKKILLLLNPAAGKGTVKNRMEKIKGVFTARGCEPEIAETLPGDSLFDQIEKLSVGKNAIVALGGDGTLNLTVNGMLKRGIDLPLGYVPLGSTNDFGDSLGLSRNPVTACENICDKEPRFIDAGRINDRYYMYIACVGMFSEVSYNTTRKLKNAIGYGAYVINGVKEIKNISKSARDLTVEFGGKAYDGRYIFLSFSNSRRAGGFFKLPREGVAFDDGKFEILMVSEPKNAYEEAVLFKDVLLADYLKDNVIYANSDEMTVKQKNPDPWSIDGEKYEPGDTAELSVISNRLLMFY